MPQPYQPRELIGLVPESDLDKFLREFKPSIYSLAVDYNKSSAEIIAASEYHWVNPEILTKDFPHDKSRGVEEVEAQLIPFGRPMGDDEVLEEYKKQGLRPATPQEQYTFGGKYPGIQGQFPIAIIKPAWTNAEGLIGSPYLGYIPMPFPEHRLDLQWFKPGEKWGPNFQFLAVAVA